jgi:hypothetical protein
MEDEVVPVSWTIQCTVGPYNIIASGKHVIDFVDSVVEIADIIVTKKLRINVVPGMGAGAPM